MNAYKMTGHYIFYLDELFINYCAMQYFFVVESLKIESNEKWPTLF